VALSRASWPTLVGSMALVPSPVYMRFRRATAALKDLCAVGQLISTRYPMPPGISPVAKTGPGRRFYQLSCLPISHCSTHRQSFSAFSPATRRILPAQILSFKSAGSKSSKATYDTSGISCRGFLSLNKTLKTLHLGHGTTPYNTDDKVKQKDYGLESRLALDSSDVIMGDLRSICD
jgi:hypothetical protein